MDDRSAPTVGAPGGDYVAEFVAELIRAGVVLAELLGHLLDAVGGEAEPGAEALLGMLVETVRATVAGAGEAAVRAITPLFDGCVRCTLEALEEAVATSPGHGS
jgi:hypothetical protein